VKERVLSNVFIVMPAYNESANIERVVADWHPIVEKIGNGSRLVIVDDGSEDDTFQILEGLRSEFHFLLPLRKENSGHGPTCLFAYDFAMRHNADYIFQTDSDGQTNPAEFWRFWDSSEEYDFIIGSRENREDGYARVFVSRTLKFLLFLVFGARIEDANTPFRLMAAPVLEKYFDLIPKNHFLANVLISVIFVVKKRRCSWIPISFKRRQGGENSINLKKIAFVGIKAIKEFRDVKKRLVDDGEPSVDERIQK